MKQLADKEVQEETLVAAAQSDRAQRDAELHQKQTQLAAAERGREDFGRLVANIVVGVTVVAVCVLGVVLLLVGLVRANHGRPNAVGYLWTGVACFAILMLAGMAWLLNEVDPQRMKSFGAVSTRKSVPGVIGGADGGAAAAPMDLDKFAADPGEGVPKRDERVFGMLGQAKDTPMKDTPMMKGTQMERADLAKGGA